MCDTRSLLLPSVFASWTLEPPQVERIIVKKSVAVEQSTASFCRHTNEVKDFLIIFIHLYKINITFVFVFLKESNYGRL